MRCRHESERYENIMDLTLEIYGWVESLEDALTQFTTPEDLDGENMYRCGRFDNIVEAYLYLFEFNDLNLYGNLLYLHVYFDERCATYVRARKQLSTLQVGGHAWGRELVHPSTPEGIFWTSTSKTSSLI